MAGDASVSGEASSFTSIMTALCLMGAGVVANGHGLFCFREGKHHSRRSFVDPRSTVSPKMASVNTWVPNHWHLNLVSRVPRFSMDLWLLLYRAMALWTLGGHLY